MGYAQTGTETGSMGMGVGMGPMGGMPGQTGYMGAYGGTPNMLQTPQPVYVVNLPGSQAQQQRAVPNSMVYGRQGLPCDQGYIDSGDGYPAMMFDVSQSGYQPPYQQNLLQASQLRYQQNYPPTAPMAHQQEYLQSTQ